MKFLKFLGGFLSFILSIIFFIFLFFFVTSMFIRHVAKEETLYRYIDKIDIFNLPASDILEENYNEEITIKDVIKKEVATTSLPTNVVDEIANSDKLISLVSRTLSEYVYYLTLEQEKPVVTSEDIENVISIDTLEKAYNRSLTTQEKQEFNKFIQNITKSINEQIPTVNIYEGNNESSIVMIVKNIIKFIFSSNFIYYMIGTFLLFFLIVMLCTWSSYKPLVWLGVPTIIMGFFLLIFYLGQSLFIKKFITAGGAIETIIIKTINAASFDLLIMGAIIFIIGIVMTITYNIIKKVKLKRNA